MLGSMAKMADGPRSTVTDLRMVVELLPRQRLTGAKGHGTARRPAPGLDGVTWATRSPMLRGSCRPHQLRATEGRAGLPQEDGRRRPLPGGEQDWQQYAGAIARWERIIGRAAPVPLNPCNSKQLNARFVEWMMGLPEGWVTDLVPNRRALHMATAWCRSRRRQRSDC